MAMMLSRWPSRLRNIATCLLLPFLIMVSAHAAGQVDFRNFRVLGKAPNFEVQTRLQYELTDYLRNALSNGVTLKARVQFRLGKHRSWWFNKDTPLVTVEYQLRYHALSERYLLLRLDTGEQWNLTSLAEALGKLGELRNYRLPTLDHVNKDEGYYLFAVADIVPATLQLPLHGFFNDDHRITSEGVFWPLP